ncbi:MAG: hypothetical protein E7408_05580 [Ruminococcaceae bacterium]|nr:hypothetical protein [Oscillospiraceae bacterium]
MQYETIILELLSRIKKLEKDVEELKQSKDNTDAVQERKNTVSYTKMTDEMIAVCYQYGKKVFEGEDAQELAALIAKETGMNRNSAFMYIYVVNSMLSGEIYKRAISKRALEIYFEKISKEYGSIGLRKAIRATRLHIDYRRGYGHAVDSVEEICNRYADRV